MAQEQVLWPGWETVKVIGKGGFGSVYEIRRDLFGTTESAALKVITIPQSDSEIDELRSDGHDRASIEKTYAQYMQSIISEYTMMRQLGDCPNIVSCDDVRYERHSDGIGWDIFIKMELLTPLTKAFPGRISEQLILKAGKDLCNALVMCKQFHVLHRDIKPQNIFISKTGEFKLGDFGIAKAAEHTMGGTKIGTYKYMAPEVYNNQPYGSAADIYSLGLVLYWMLNEHRLPFLPMPPAMPTFSDEEQAKLRRFRGEPIPAPKNGSPALKAIVLKACAFNPADRFASAADMLKALEQINQKTKSAPVSKTTEPEESLEDKTIRVRQTKATPNFYTYSFKPVGESAEFVINPIPEPSSTTPPKEPVRPPKNGKASDQKKPATTKKRKIKVILLILIICVVLAAITVLYIINTRNLSNSGWQNVTAVSAGNSHTVGLRKDGTVVAVGWNYYGQCNVEDWTDIAAVNAGDSHTVGLKKDGTVVSVGWNYYGQCDVGNWTDIIAVNAGGSHTVGLKKDGTVVAAGQNYYGQCNVEDWSDIVAVSAGDCHTVGLKKDGTVVAVGRNYDNQCDVGNWTDIIAVNAGGSHTVGLKKDGTVVAVGENSSGQCDVGAWTDIVAVHAGALHTVGLKKDGTVVAVGNNFYGTCNVDEWTDIVAVCADSSHTVGLKKDGTVVAIGENTNGQCGVS